MWFLIYLFWARSLIFGFHVQEVRPKIKKERKRNHALNFSRQNTNVNFCLGWTTCIYTHILHWNKQGYIYISIRPDIYGTSICTCSFQGFTKSILLNCCLLILVLKNVYLSEWFDIICSFFALDFLKIVSIGLSFLKITTYRWNT